MEIDLTAEKIKIFEEIASMLANATIVSLSPLDMQSSTDIYEVSKNGAGSFKETRAQQNTYWNANIQLPSTTKVTGLDAALAAKLNLAGGTMTGALTLNADPTTNLEAATKQYVDSVGASISLQQAYNSSSPKKINFDPGQGLIFADSLDLNRFVFSETLATFLNPLIVSKIGDEGISVLESSDIASTMFEVYSTDKGAKFAPAWTETVRDTIPTGAIVDYLAGYNTTKGTLDLRVNTGSNVGWQNVLMSQRVRGTGTNTATVDADGGVTIFGAGSAVPDAAFGAFSIADNNIATTFASPNTFYPMYAGTTFKVTKSSDFTVAFQTILGQTTPVLKSTSPITQNYTFTFCFSGRGAVATTATFNPYIYILKADGTTIISTDYSTKITLANLVDFDGLSITGQVELAQDDLLFVQIRNITNTNSVYISDVTANCSSVAGSISNAVLTSEDQTIGGTKTFSNIIMGDLGGVASSANTINTAMQYTNLDYYVGFYPSQTNGYQQTRIASTLQANPLRYNPVTGALTTVSFIGSLSGNADTVTNGVYTAGNQTIGGLKTFSSSPIISGLGSANALVGTDGTKTLTTNVSQINPTLYGLSLNNGGSPLAGISCALNFGSAIQYGNYINFGSFGPFMGVDSNANGVFLSGNLMLAAPLDGFLYLNTAGSGMLRVDQSGVRIQHAIPGTASDPATLVTDIFVDTSGNINLPNKTASQLLATDASKNIVSIPSYVYTAFVTVSSSTQSLALGTRYINKYSGGQMEADLPAATGSGREIQVIGDSTASTAGWKVTADGTDLIQFESSISSAGGSISSTPGSATDIATFIDSEAGKWIVYLAAGLDLVVA